MLRRMAMAGYSVRHNGFNYSRLANYRSLPISIRIIICAGLFIIILFAIRQRWPLFIRVHLHYGH